ncbi:DEKNAAC104104 [Brettanomyces naardenensis]|uniref:DEKNAAC104104 n=1 Tax=Brettanomyces naardenensis TaxID=13370 RepID=A0A448YPY8_BRENA|nr:DEKNAAC104104 [Brettanomyces naardenensis]
MATKRLRITGGVKVKKEVTVKEEFPCPGRRGSRVRSENGAIEAKKMRRMAMKKVVVKTEPKKEPTDLLPKSSFILGDIQIRSLKLLHGFTRIAEKDHWRIPTPELKRKPRLKYRPANGTVLDIRDLDFAVPLEDQVELEDVYFLHHAITYSKKVVMVIGAGVSVESGIPDFRSANGLFQGFATKSNGSGKNLFDYNVFRSDDSIKKFENMIQRLYTLSSKCEPSLFHHMIDQLSSQGRLLRLYTQNIDCLDTQLPHLHTKVPLTFKKPYPKAVQLHGNVKLLSCSMCKYVTPLDESFFEKPTGPDGRKLIVRCPECEEMNKVRAVVGKRLQNEGVLRPRIVLYNEFHPDGEIVGNITESDLKARPDCLIVTGTTLKIPGVRRLVKEMARVVHSRNGYVIWINLDEPTQTIVDYVEFFDLIVVGNCQLIPGLVKLYDYVYKPKGKASGKRPATGVASKLPTEAVQGQKTIVK